MADGLAAGRTAASPVVERCITQTRRMVETPAERSPIVLANAALGDDVRAALAEAVERHVRPAQAAWLAMLERYAAGARPGDGICHLPDGEALYRHHILAWTTLDEDPVSIHEYGLARLAELEAEERHIAAELGHADVRSLRAFLDASRGQPRHRARGAGRRRPGSSSRAPRPRRRAGSGACRPTAARSAPSSRTWSRRRRRRSTCRPARTARERASTSSTPAIRPRGPCTGCRPRRSTRPCPGHHFQIAIEQELTDLPTFRRFGSRLAGGAYVEGWGLYAERLAHEMGLYRSPRERFGALESEAWRAARLVVDTGIHALGWTRQQSIDLLRERAGLSQLEAETETDRYISWPGQALSYMIGQREILALRAELERRDGDRFDLRAFHDAVIGHGSLPLSTLRARLPGWLAPRAG